MAAITSLVDRVKIVVLSSGTGPFALGQAVPAFRGTEALLDGATYSYATESGSNFEVGTGVFLASSNTLVRSPLLSSNNGAAIAFPANIEVAFTVLAQDIAPPGTLPIVQATGTGTQVAMSQNAVTVSLNALATALADLSGSIGSKAEALALGVSGSSTDMGSYSSAEIPANGTAKENIQALSDAVAARALIVNSRTALAAVPPALRTLAYLNEGGRSGFFGWFSSDQSANVTRDTLQGVYVPPTGGTGSTGAWVRTEIDELNIAWWGAVGDGVTDCSEAIRLALREAQARGGGVVYIPVGTWRKDDTTLPISIYNNTTMRGEGDASILFHDDRPDHARNDMFYSHDVDRIAFRDFKIQGTLRTYPNETNFCQTLTGDRIGKLTIENVSFVGLRQMATAFTVVNDVLFSGCRLEDVIRDGARFIQARNVRVTNNYFLRVADDCIAVHSRDDATGTVLPQNIVITGNVMEICQGIKLLGPKNAVVANNTMRYMLQNPIAIWNNISLPEGNTPVYSVVIEGNTILDTMSIFDTPYVIQCDFRNRSKGALSAQPGAVAPIFPYSQDNDTDAAGAINLGGIGLRISGNIIAWTAPRGSVFSAYGIGDILNRDSAYGPAAFIDPVMTDAVYNCRGIDCLGPVRSLEISNNQFFGGTAGTGRQMVRLQSDATAANTIVASDVILSGNIFSDCPGDVCVSINYVTTNGAQYTNITGNTFDLDPFFRNSAHSADNSWTSDDACIPFALNTLLTAGSLGGNHFKNCSRIFGSGGTPILVTEDNFAYFNFVAGGVFDGSADNRGIRNVPFVPRVTCVMIDGDPTSSTFNRLVTLPARTAASIPATGKYVRGHFVRNVNPIVVGSTGAQYVVNGWLRITNGSSHVLNTDWVEERTLTGT